MNFKKQITGLLLTLAIVSCDKDALELGDQSGFFGSENFESFVELFDITTNNSIDFDGIQSDNLTLAPLGAFQNEGIQDYTAHYVTQLTLPTKPNFPVTTVTNSDGTTTTTVNPVTVEKVIIYVPYFIKSKTGTSPNETYVLDSIYNKTVSDKINLKIFRNNYLLRDFNPGSTTSQNYFTNQYNDFNNALGSNPQLNLGITGASTTENTEFVFSKDKILNKIPKIDGTFEDENLAPGLFAQLQKADFQAIINEFVIEQKFPSTSNVYNQNVFNNYFRGLFFKIDETIGSKHALGLLNFSGGFVRVYYKEQPTTGDASIKTMDIKFGGKNVSLVEKQNDIQTTSNIVIKPYQDNIQTFQLNLFNRSNSISDRDELKELRARFKDEKWLLNNVDLTFHVVDDLERINPPRLYVYDFTNNKVLADFVDDSSQNTSAKFRFTTFGGFYNKTTKAYVFRLTNHIRSILTPTPDGESEAAADEDLTKALELANIKIGLVAVENISDFSLINTKTGSTINERFIPRSAVYQMRATVLYNIDAVDVSKKPELKINYIKPKNNN